MLESLEELVGNSVQVSENDAYPAENGAASVLIIFSAGTMLRAEYWRLIKNGRAHISSFDHMQKYGLPVPIDAIDILSRELLNQAVEEAHHDEETGDLALGFSNCLKLQILNFTDYEIWEISFPNGAVQYSNYSK